MHEGADLHGQVQALKLRYPDPGAAIIGEIVMAMLSSMTGDMGVREAALLYEVGTLGAAVAEARQEIAALKVEDISVSHIPCATDELDAIVAHTAAATESILEVCETLDKLGDSMAGEAGQHLSLATSRIYEACSFQDITGQRITKVVGTLKTIEAMIARITDRFGGGIAGVSGPVQDPVPSLLNGPQLPAAAMDQTDIDKLLASFD